MSPPSRAPDSGRAAIACRTCRRRKVKCTGGQPCSNCAKWQSQCEYPPQLRRKRHKANFDGGPTLLDRQIPHDQFDEESTFRSHDPQPPIGDSIHVASLSQTSQAARQAVTPQFLSPQSISHGDDVAERRVDRSPVAVSNDDRSVQRRDETNQEADDLFPWISACSDAGISWVCEVTGSRAFANVASRFPYELGCLVSPDARLTLHSRTPEPEEARAWEYVNAFFDNCWEAHIGLVHQPDFEAKLQAHFHAVPSSSSQYADIALRNVIFAAGCRSISAQEAAASFNTDQTYAWQGYFHNALSLLSELLLLPSSPTVLQALALMACYADVFDGPGYQHVLCSNAVHVALTQGLHRQSDRLVIRTSDEDVRKAVLWWAFYVLEKHLSSVNGRSSMIDDDTISTPIPSRTPPESCMDFENLTLAIRHAKLSSQISREITSPKARKASAKELLEVIKDLDKQLKDLLEQVPLRLRVGTLSKRSDGAQLLSYRFHASYLHFSIHGSLLALHSRLFSPWLSVDLFKSNADVSLSAQLAASCTTVAEAARKILLAVRTVTPNVATPTWAAVSYPLYAHLSLLTYILRYPGSPTASADLGLLDISAGHFGYIEFMTSSRLSLSLPRESVNIAGKLVKEAKLQFDKDSASGLRYSQVF